MARPSERDRYKYGICTNRDKNGEGTPCPKCESKEVQKVRAGQASYAKSVKNRCVWFRLLKKALTKS